MFTSRIPAVAVPTESAAPNGSPTIILPNPEDPAKPGKCFGVTKIRAVLDNLEPCRAFVAKHHKPKAEKDDTKAKVKAMLANIGTMDKAAIERALASIA